MSCCVSTPCRPIKCRCRIVPAGTRYRADVLHGEARCSRLPISELSQCYFCIISTSIDSRA